MRGRERRHQESRDGGEQVREGFQASRVHGDRPGAVGRQDLELATLQGREREAQVQGENQKGDQEGEEREGRLSGEGAKEDRLITHFSEPEPVDVETHDGREREEEKDGEKKPDDTGRHGKATSRHRGDYFTVIAIGRARGRGARPP